MNFLNALPLWGSLAALGVATPIIIHLLHRNHKQETPWAAMELLRKAMVVRSQRVKMEDYLLLFLRCLAMLLIAFALLRPLLTSDRAEWLGDKAVGVVIGIDASFSMNHGEHSHFEKAIAKTKDILSTVEEGTPVSIVLMSNRPEILFRRTGYSEASFTLALDAVEKASMHRLSLEPNLENLEELVAELKTASRECYLISDAQASDWAELSDAGKESFSRLEQVAKVFVVPIDAEGEDNVSITDLAYASGTLQRSGSARFAATIRNEGRHEVDAGLIEFYANEKLIARRDVGRLNAGETRSVSFFTSFEKSGDFQIGAKLSKDDLSEDNQRFAVVNIQSTIRVLCVDGDLDVSTKQNPRGAYFASRALGLKPRGEDNPIIVTHIDADDFSQEKLGDFDMVVMVDVGNVAPEMADRLYQFTSMGGGLIIFLGEKVDAERYNETFGFEEKGLLPGKLIDVVVAADPNEGWQIGKVESDHSLASLVSSLPKDVAAFARVASAVRVEPSPGGHVILRLSHKDTPLLLSRQIDSSGTVLLFTTSGDRSWSNLAIHPLFTMFLQQAATVLTSQPGSRQFLVSDPEPVTVVGRRVGDHATLIKPDGDKSTLVVTQSGQHSTCVIEADNIGFYQIEGDEKIDSVFVAANVDANESNVQVLDSTTLTADMKELGVQVAGVGTALAELIESSRSGRDLTKLLLSLGVIVFLLQGLLAKYFSNRTKNTNEDISDILQKGRVAASRRS